MSKKNRKNQIKQPEIIGLEISTPSESRLKTAEAISDCSSTAEIKTPVLKNGLNYLKLHILPAAIICFLALGALGAGLKFLDEDAKREIASRANNKGSLNNQEQSFLNKINPFLPAAMPSPTPQLSKEYIYAGSRMLAVEDANASSAPPADLAVWRPSSGVWWILSATGSQQFSTTWGISGDIPVQGDYDGDGKADLAIWRPSTGYWWVLRSSDNSYFSVPLGLSGDKPVQADYDGDGKVDMAVFRPSNATWYIYQTSTGNTVYDQYGYGTDTPIPADFDGDGKADIAVWRNSNTTFYSKNSSNMQNQETLYGSSGDSPVPADYDGDGKADIAVWRSSNATWYIKQSSNSQSLSYQLGISTDITVQNDYDGDGKVDIAVWRNSDGTWLIRQSSRIGQTNELRQSQWGLSGDIPVPALYRR